MNIQTGRRLVLPVGIGLVSVWLVVAGLGTARAQSKTPLAAAVVNRPQDPVVVTGAYFPAFSGVPVDELVLYAYRSATWIPIPF